MKYIRIRGLYKHNLKSIDLDIPIGKFISVIGPSGAGKSSLVIDSIHAEAQRRYIETFSPYVRQFLERRALPEARLITNLPPSIAVLGKNPIKNARSTVATLAELTFSIRQLFVRFSTLSCPYCNIDIEAGSADAALSILKEIVSSKDSQGVFLVCMPLDELGSSLLELEVKGFSRLFIDGRVIRIQDINLGETDGENAINGIIYNDSNNGIKGNVYVVSDRIKIVKGMDIDRGLAERIKESITVSFFETGGRATCFFIDEDKGVIGPYDILKRDECPNCRRQFHKPTLSLFSFNSPLGACSVCEGFGKIPVIDKELCIPNKERSILEGASPILETWREEKQALIDALTRRGIDPDTPWNMLNKETREWIMQGGDGWIGIAPFLKNLEDYRYKAHIRIFLSRFRSYSRCHACNGSRFKRDALAFKVFGKDIAGLYNMTIAQAYKWVRQIREGAGLYAEKNNRAFKMLISDLEERLYALNLSGIGYLTLNRQSRTLSGGEMLRVFLARAFGNALQDTLYCIDEPTKGLHPRDVKGILRLIRELRDKGNTIIAITHDASVISASDEVIELGPGAGSEGGRVQYQGPPEGIIKKYIKEINPYTASTASIPSTSFTTSTDTAISQYIEIKGARCHNLKSIDVRIPLNALTAVTGVSGSGKSSLVEDVLFKAVKRRLGEPVEGIGEFDSISGCSAIKGAVIVDQSSLIRTPRATVGTYTQLLNYIRRLYALTEQAKSLGLKEGNLSFQSPRGRCHHCKGLGLEVIDMQFLPDVTLPCPVCKGKRFSKEVGEITFNGLSLFECLDMSINDAITFFNSCDGKHDSKKYLKAKDIKGLHTVFSVLKGLGLGHLSIGQRLNMLSEGEAQRLRLARAMIMGEGGDMLYILDEPTRSLHPEEGELIIESCKRLVRLYGATIVAVEHNPNFVKNSDWIIALGHEGGEKGGYLIYEGKPDKIGHILPEIDLNHIIEDDIDHINKIAIKNKDILNVTIPNNKMYPLGKERGDSYYRHDSISSEQLQRGYIKIRGASHHNLRSVDVNIPREKFVVITGPSGAGKSTLAFDIIHSEGERRYIECLPSYMRQFIRLYERPDVEEIRGISPSVAIEQRKARGSSMSTVATLTEIAHFLRLLYAKTAEAVCPKCGNILKTIEEEIILKEIKKRLIDKELYLIAPRVSKRKGFLKNILEDARIYGASFILIDGKFYPCNDYPSLDRYSPHSISWVFGPVSGSRQNLNKFIKYILYYGGGQIGIMGTEVLKYVERGDKRQVSRQKDGQGHYDMDYNIEFFSAKRHCGRCGIGAEDPDPLLFSFSTPSGRCMACGGTGLTKGENTPCKVCGGSRLSKDALLWVIDGMTIGDFMGLQIDEAIEVVKRWLAHPPTKRHLKAIVAGLIKEITRRLEFLMDVGLGYLRLNRAGNTLSGGEAQRIRLASQMGSGLTGLTIVLDEPTIGLHPSDNKRLLRVFDKLKQAGCTVIVVEHDEQTIMAADWIIDLGPDGGKKGGRVVTEGKIDTILKDKRSPTGRALHLLMESQGQSQRQSLCQSQSQCQSQSPTETPVIRFSGIKKNNINDETVAVPLRKMVAVVGVSGSGKSTLLEDIFFKGMHLIKQQKKNAIKDNHFSVTLNGDRLIRDVKMVDSSPIGRTPRSCVITYLGLYSYIREILSKTPVARMKGYGHSIFSFNVRGGRCEHCKGLGKEEVRLGFLPPVYVTCPECNGRQFIEEVLEVEWNSKNISEIISMTVEEAYSFFAAHPSLRRAFKILVELGLGYIELGQQSPYLSGGEAQRLKLARELLGKRPKDVVYLLDEPTTGLHIEDVRRLMRHLRGLCDMGNTVIIVEHNRDVIMTCDHVIELGPKGGNKGGKVIFNGPVGQFIRAEEGTPTQEAFNRTLFKNRS